MNEIPRPALGAAEPPLVVDLDGTLLRTDLLFETFALMLLSKPWLLACVPFWLLRGRAHLKRQLARSVDLDIGSLPVNTQLLAWLRAERAKGRRLALVSASDQGLVERVAAHFSGLFDTVQGSDGVTNLAGARKLAALRSQFGSGFSYAGDERRDFVIWEYCRSAILAGKACRLRHDLSADVQVAAEFAAPPVTARVWARAMRVQQSAKNALLFVPLVLSGGFLDPERLGAVVLGFIAFSLAASGSYIFNDLVDLRADRLHRSKSRRPLASGELPLRAALLALPVIALAVVVLLSFLPQAFAFVTAAYLAITLAYSFILKRLPVLDLIVIASLFTLRIVAGIAVSGTGIAPWLLVFSMFFFFSLATVKRYSECRVMAAERRSEVTGRGYVADDATTLMAMGVAGGFCSILVFLLFLIDPASPVSGYAHPQMLWAVCLVLAYWLSRAWLLAGRGMMHDDVVVFALKDRASLVLGAVCVLLGLLANL